MEVLGMSLPDLVTIGIEILALVGILPRLRGYFDARSRRERAGLLSSIAEDVVNVVALQGGMSPLEAANSVEALAIMRDRVISEGGKAAKAKAVAERVLASKVIVLQEVADAKAAALAA